MRKPPIERFLALVEVGSDPNACWDWRGYVHSGYGQFRDGVAMRLAHRWSYEHYVGPIPKGLTLDHLCRNRGCVNPAHLEPVTNRENVMRGTGSSSRFARRDRCSAGHVYTPETTWIRTRNGRPSRVCRICSNSYGLALRERRVAA